MKLSFLGGAREVTGSCFLVETANTRFLVDCGMVQGGKNASERNRQPFKFNPASLDFVLLTHAHIDHSGLLPKLSHSGFKGPIYTSEATADLLGVILPDNAYIQECDAKHESRRRRHRTGTPPIYTLDDARKCLRQIRRVDYDQKFSPHATVECRFRNAGHVLGSAIIELWITEYNYPTKLVFSGGLGQPGHPFLQNPTPINNADLVVLESTYGNRQHQSFAATESKLVAIVKKTLFEHDGNVIIPALAVGHTQQIIYQLHRLIQEGRLRPPKIFIDSPMGSAVAAITREHMKLFDLEAKHISGTSSLEHDFPYLRFTASVRDSKALNHIRSGAIILSASNMCDAGRIRHHLRHNLPRQECSVVIPGFQAKGTLGRCLVDGTKQVRIYGEDIPVRASIFSMESLSAYADQDALLAWATAFEQPPAQTFIVHGEPTASQTLADTLSKALDWEIAMPTHGDEVLWPSFLSAPSTRA